MRSDTSPNSYYGIDLIIQEVTETCLKKSSRSGLCGTPSALVPGGRRRRCAATPAFGSQGRPARWGRQARQRRPAQGVSGSRSDEMLAAARLRRRHGAPGCDGGMARPRAKFGQELARSVAGCSHCRQAHRRFICAAAAAQMAPTRPVIPKRPGRLAGVSLGSSGFGRSGRSRHFGERGPVRRLG